MVPESQIPAAASASPSDHQGAPAGAPHPIPGRGLHTEEARQERLHHLRNRTGAQLRSLERMTLSAPSLSSNVENLVGSVEVPVGVAGPLLLSGRAVRGMCYLPLATTEGALVSSATRGALALTASGGVRAEVLERRMTRAPLFAFRDFAPAAAFCAWLAGEVPAMRERTRDVSRHAELLDVQTVRLGPNVVVRLAFRTGDAAGQNMTTACAWHLCRWIAGRLRDRPDLAPEACYVESNASLDKKIGAAAGGGRGLRVVASATLRDDVCRRVLKVPAARLLWAYQRSMEAALQAGMVGHNVNAANVVAGAFIATGQDVACVHESSVAQLVVQECPAGVQASLTLPSLVIGTVGGGTHLPRQQDLLDLAGCAGEGKVERLGEIIAGFCLALDLSTLAAVVGGQFASAHERMGRNRPRPVFSEKELGAAFFEPGLRQALDDPSLAVEAALPLPGVALDGGLLGEMTRLRNRRAVGLFPRRITFRSPRHGPGTRDVLVRVKPLDEEVLLMAATVAQMCGGRLGELARRHAGWSGLAGTHRRELGVYRQVDPRFTRHAPAVLGVVEDEKRDLFAVVLELLGDVDLRDCVADRRGWTPAHVEAAIRGIAEVHSIWYGREEELREQPWLGRPGGDPAQALELWAEILSYAADEFPAWFPGPERLLHAQALAALPASAAERAQLPRTLIHGDFNPRNLAFRRDADGPRLCAWDWELAAVEVPQRDLAEILAFVLTPDARREEVDARVELHRVELEHHAGRAIDPQSWRRGYQLALLDLLAIRLGFYLLAHAFRACPFLERVLATTRHLLRLEGFGRGGDDRARTPSSRAAAPRAR